MQEYRYNSFRYSVDPQVYRPAEDTFLLAATIQKEPPTGRVLEIGTGCGLISLIAAQTALQVVATDINPHAVTNAQLNARTNRLDSRIEILRCSLASALGEHYHFDHVVCNPPYLPIKRSGGDWLSGSWEGGDSGVEFAVRILDGAEKVLSPRGDYTFLVSGDDGLQRVTQYVDSLGWVLRVLDSASFFYERIFVVRVERAS